MTMNELLHYLFAWLPSPFYEVVTFAFASVFVIGFVRVFVNFVGSAWHRS